MMRKCPAHNLRILSLVSFRFRSNRLETFKSPIVFSFQNRGSTTNFRGLLICSGVLSRIMISMDSVTASVRKCKCTRYTHRCTSIKILNTFDCNRLITRMLGSALHAYTLISYV